MKFRLVSDAEYELDESTFSKKNLWFHAITRGHINEYRHDPRFVDFNHMTTMDKLRLYNKIGEDLSNATADTVRNEDSRIVGFITKDDRTVKYDRMYNDFIVFNSDDSISLHKKTEKQFQNIVRRDYLKDIPKES